MTTFVFSRLAIVGFLFLSFSWSQVGAQESTPLSETEFQQYMTEVNTSLDKPWRQIPWKISLLDAQNLAASERKPIFIWAMDGHPLGCT